MAARRPSASGLKFIETMDCLPVPKIPEGDDWTFEIKLDGYRLEAIKSRSAVTLYSRRRNVLNEKFSYIADALGELPEGTILDGELVALDDKGISNFHLLQNFKSARTRIKYFAFDLLACKGKSLLDQPLAERRETLEHLLPRNDHVNLSAVDTRSPAQLLRFIKQHGLEGVIAKRADSRYEPGKRSGLWTKTRIDSGQEFVVGGYTAGSNGFDALLIGFYRAGDFIYAAKVRAGFVPATRREVAALFAGLRVKRCPFANLPEKTGGRWGDGLTAEKMTQCHWLKPVIVARIDFREWTGADHLRHTKFVAIRDDKDPRKVVRET